MPASTRSTSRRAQSSTKKVSTSPISHWGPPRMAERFPSWEFLGRERLPAVRKLAIGVTRNRRGAANRGLERRSLLLLREAKSEVRDEHREAAKAPSLPPPARQSWREAPVGMRTPAG